MNAVTLITPETSKRLANVEIKAESSPEGSRFFVQLSYYPIVLLQVITGVNMDDSGQKSVSIWNIFLNHQMYTQS